EYFRQGQNVFESSGGSDSQFFAMAVKYDPSLGPKIAAQFYDRGKAAFALRDLTTAEQLLGRAGQFDRSVNQKIALVFADAASSDLEAGDLTSAEQLAGQARAYDAAVARQQARGIFDKLDFCNLRAIGKEHFMATMKLCTDLGLPEATRKSLAYRFSYAVTLYENGPRLQGIDIFQDIARTSPKYCEGVEANKILSP